MHFSLIRYILFSFIAVVVGFVLACLVSLALLEQAATQLDASGVDVSLDLIRNSQAWIACLCLLGLVIGFLGMAFATHAAARIIDRLRQATRYLGDVVLDEMSPSEFLTDSDGLSREVQEMMLKIKDSQLRYLDASPLTRLPGNLAIEQVLKEKMDHGEKFALCYIDLDDFKAFNDKYGYAKGSDVIKMTGEALPYAKDEYADQQDFVGHIGGDDFLIITTPEISIKMKARLEQRFETEVVTFYNFRDREHGHVEIIDSTGNTQTAPLMTLAIGRIQYDTVPFSDIREITEVAAEARRSAQLGQ